MIWTCLPLLLLAPDPGGSPFPAVSFDPEEARMRLAQVEEALQSFTALTEIVLGGQMLTAHGRLEPVTVDPSVLLGLAYTYWEDQYIGFPNFVRFIRGTVESQALEILELRIRVLELEGAPPGDIAALVEEADAQRVVVEGLSSSGWMD